MKSNNDVKEIKYKHNAPSEKFFYSSGDEFVQLQGTDPRVTASWSFWAVFWLFMAAVSFGNWKSRTGRTLANGT